MKITCNGKPKALTDEKTLLDLVNTLDLANKRIAIELNEVVIPRSLYDQTPISAGDVVEVVHAIGGG